MNDATQVEEMVDMKKKLTSVTVGLVSAVAFFAAGTSANAASSLCPESAAACQKPARPDAGTSAKSSTVRAKIVPQRAKGARGQEAWQIGKWLME